MEFDNSVLVKAARKKSHKDDDMVYPSIHISRNGAGEVWVE
jgi:hypothetical protein